MAGSLEIAEVRERLRTDTKFWAEHCATILNEDKVAVRLKARPWQAHFDDELEKQHAAGRPMRAIVLKSRKLGYSTWVAAKFTQRVTQYPFEYAVVAAQDRQTAGIMMDMVALMVGRLPTFEQLGLGFSIRPQIIGQGSTRNGSRFMTLGDRKRPHEASVYETMTAGARAKGRGYTPSMMHCSELAHWEDEDVIPGMLNAVPKRPGTIVVIESTANGFNHFHGRWERAVAGAEDPETGGLYVPIFFGLARQPVQRAAVCQRPGARPLRADDRRPGRRRRRGGAVAHRAVRRDARAAVLAARDDERGVRRQDRRVPPGAPGDARSGVHRVGHPRLLGDPRLARDQGGRGRARAGAGVPARRRLAGTPHALRGRFACRRPSHGSTARTRPRSTTTRGGRRSGCMVWEHPLNAASQQGVPAAERKPDGQYVVFVDVAQGVGGTLEERDFSAIQVLDHITRMQVARWRSRVDIHDLPLLALLTAMYYNEAWLAVEKTGLGIGVVDALQKDYHYRRMYRTHRPGDDEVGDNTGRQIGWSTDRRTKPLMEMAFGQALKDETHGLRDVTTAREISTYVEDPKNRRSTARRRARSTTC
jgi:hypothetical protein